MIVKAFATRPLKPDKLPPEFNVNVAEVNVSVPAPESVPFSVMVFDKFGLLPSGKLQLLWTVLVPVFTNANKLKLTLLHVMVPAPAEITVPPL